MGRKFSARRKARFNRGRAKQRDRVILGLGPVDHQQAEVGEWIAQSAELPVDDRGNLAQRAVDHIVKPVIAMHDRRLGLLGNRGEQFRVYLLDCFKFTRLRLLPLSRPALQLSGDVALATSQLTQADRVRVERVDLGPSSRPGPRRSAGAGPDRERAPPHRMSGGPVPRRTPSHRTGAPVTDSSSQKPTTGGTGTGVPASAVTTLTSRPMSWAEPSRAPSGGRRRTQREPPDR